MGWHRVSLPRQQVSSLDIEFTGIRKGTGPDNDICVSELALYNRGRPVDMQMPRAVLYRLSYCCGGTGYLLTRRGRVLATGEMGEGLDVEWNPRNNLVAGVDGAGGSSRLWVSNVKRGCIIFRTRLKSVNVSRLEWKGRNTIEAVFYNDRTGNTTARQRFEIT
jgi:hypothetical protein